jgi:uncharacterized membrane protein required for colicin V production
MLLADIPFGMNWFDVIWIAALLYGLWDGTRTGLLGEISHIVSWILVLAMSMLYYESVGVWFKESLELPLEQARLTAFIMLVVCLYTLAMLLRKIINRWAARTTGTAFLQNIGGAAAGLVRMSLAMMFLTIALSLTRSPFWHEQVGKESKFGVVVVSLFPSVQAVVNRDYPETGIVKSPRKISSLRPGPPILLFTLPRATF